MTVPLIVPALGGAALLALLLAEVAIGKRWIRLGKQHLKWHKWLAFALVGLAVVQAAGSIAALYF